MSESFLPGEGSKKNLSKKIFKYDANVNRVELSNYRADGKVNSTNKSTYIMARKGLLKKHLLTNTILIKKAIEPARKKCRIAN